MCVVNFGDSLGNDRAFVEFGVDVVSGGTDGFDSAFESLVVGLGAFETGQEGMVNIDDSTLPPSR